METGALRTWGPIAHDPPPRRDDVTGSPAVTELPTEKTVRPVQATTESRASGDRRLPAEAAQTLAVKTGFERDPSNGSIVYRWTDETTGRVLFEIPRSDQIRSGKLYDEQSHTPENPTVDRSV